MLFGLGVSAMLGGCAVNPAPRIAARQPHWPARLMGISTASLRADFGKPALRRVDGPAQVWLYYSNLCRLDVVLYPGRTGVPVVSMAKPLPRGISRTSCVASLEQSRAS